MPAKFKTPAAFVAIADGTAFVQMQALAGYIFPVAARAKDGASYGYYAQSADGVQFQHGVGVWDTETLSLTYGEIERNSDGDTDPIVFTSAPEVYIFPAVPSGLEERPFSDLIPAATTMVFYQAAAPTGWTKITAQNDKALRVVSGTGGGAGGTNAFSSMFASRTVDNTTLTIPQIPAHDHAYVRLGVRALTSGLPWSSGADYENYEFGANTGGTGGGGSHNHTIDMRVQYCDVIFASKDAYP